MMTEQLTTYTVKSKQDGYVWLFKYDLNGHLRQFLILEAALTGTQMKWLFSGANFPAFESMMKNEWMTKLKANFEIVVGMPEITFEVFWEKYDHKVKKAAAQKKWQKLTDAQRIKAVINIDGYRAYLQRSRIAKAHPATYLSEDYIETDWRKVNN